MLPIGPAPMMAILCFVMNPLFPPFALHFCAAIIANLRIENKGIPLDLKKGEN